MNAYITQTQIMERSIRSLYFLPKWLHVRLCFSTTALLSTPPSLPRQVFFLVPRCGPHPSPSWLPWPGCGVIIRWCHGDTHHPSLPIPSGLGLLLPLFTWRLEDCSELRLSRPAPWYAYHPSGSGPCQGAASSGFSEYSLLLVQVNRILLKDYFE